MNLDNPEKYKQLDPQNMYAHIIGLPVQLINAWDLGMNFPELTWNGKPRNDAIHQVIVCGMGGSAIGADLLVSYLEPYLQVPIFVHRDYGLPAWANSSETLVIASSHSGNTEETLDSFAQAQKNGCRCMAICTGGELLRRANEQGVPVWLFNHDGQPRSAVGFSFGLLLSAFCRLGLVNGSDKIGKEILNASKEMQLQQTHLLSDVPTVSNPAKRLAGQLYGRWVTILGSGMLAPVARRWKGQISEIAKAWAQFEAIPEADHNTLAGTFQPEDLLNRMMVLFLRSPSDHPRNALRLQNTRMGFMIEGLNTDFYESQGEGRLAQQWTTLHFGDFTAYYLAMAYEVDPTPIVALQNFKAQLNSI
jgi:glucose/mannose-6-phosphate isomerase